MRQLAFVGASSGIGQSKPGVETGPSVLREFGIINWLQKLELDVTDYGDLISIEHSLSLQNSQNRDERFKLAGSLYEPLALACQNAAEDNKFCFVVGGDHSIALASITGLLRVYPDLIVLWVDAHGDINTCKTSPTGFLHGMPLAGLLGIDDVVQALQCEWLKGNLSHERVVLIGPRDLDQGEREIIAKEKICVYSSDEVKSYGMNKVLKKALNQLDPQNQAPLHLSFDIDIIDPRLAPATGVPVVGGLGLGDLRDLGQSLRKTGRLVSMDLVEFNPQLALGSDELIRTYETIKVVLKNLFSDR